LAEQIAEYSLEEVLRRTSGLTPDMSSAEARGYIRARAARVVNREVLRVCHYDRRLKRLDPACLTTLTTEVLIEAVLREYQAARRTLAA
jgi:hypothetical protein